MKKNLKIIIIILLCTLVAWITLVIIDYVRLKNAQSNIKPFITVNTKYYNNTNRYGTEYIGLGYSVEYYKSKNTTGYGTKIKLFNTIPIWDMEAQ